MIVQSLGFFIALGLSPFFVGLIQTTKARIQGRHGPSVWQGYYVLFKYWKKETTVPANSSLVFVIAHIVSISVIVVIMLVIPWGKQLPAVLSGDFIMVFFLLALERFWTALAGLDTSGTFGGFGASRILTIGIGLEPMLFAVFGLCFFLTGNSHFAQISPLWFRQAPHVLAWLLAAGGFVLTILLEIGRLPIDNPDTHLELTMMHEATQLEYNGRLFAFSQFSAMSKVTAMLGIGWVWFGPSLSSPWWTLLLHLCELGVSSILIGVVESFTIKMRFFRIPYYVSAVIGMGLLAVVITAF
jgi:formate hydrogenlyase subunit 4